MHRQPSSRLLALICILASLLQACTLAGTGLGMAASPPGRLPKVTTLHVRPPALTREILISQLDMGKGDTIRVTHANATIVTTGTYAGTSPEDSPRRYEQHGGRKVVFIERQPHGILVQTGSGIVVVPYEKVSQVRIEHPHPPLWALGTVVGLVVDVVIYFGIRNISFGFT